MLEGLNAVFYAGQCIFKALIFWQHLGVYEQLCVELVVLFHNQSLHAQCSVLFQ